MDKPSVSDSRTVKYEEYDVDLRQYRTKITAYIDYPRGSSAIDTRFGHNEEELDKVEAFFSPLLSNPNVLFKEIRITGMLRPKAIITVMKRSRKPVLTVSGPTWKNDTAWRLILSVSPG